MKQLGNLVERVDWSTHAALIASGAVGAVLVIRLLAVGEWDTSTAHAILQTGGTGTVLLGAMVSLVSAVLPGALAVAIARPAYRWGRGAGRPDAALVMSTILFVLVALLVAPMVYLIVGVPVASFLAFLIGRADTGKPEDLATRDNLRMLATALVFGSASVLLVSAQPWLPREVLIITGGDRVVGYVLVANSDSTAVLQHQPRQVIYLDHGSVVRRAICDPERSWWWKRVPANYSQTATDYPACPRQ
jgi:hypothetical protein